MYRDIRYPPSHEMAMSYGCASASMRRPSITSISACVSTEQVRGHLRSSGRVVRLATEMAGGLWFARTCDQRPTVDRQEWRGRKSAHCDQHDAL